jgi:hypothetical protein
MKGKKVRWPSEASRDNVFPVFKTADGGGRCTLIGLRSKEGMRLGAVCVP